MKSLLSILALFALTLFQTRAADEGPYRHVVFFKFKETASQEEVHQVEKAFGALNENKALKITDFEWGKNVSPEGLDNGFTHCFFVTFASKADLEAYLPHQAHQDFVAILKPHLDKVMVIDYVAKKTVD